MNPIRAFLIFASLLLPALSFAGEAAVTLSGLDQARLEALTRDCNGRTDFRACYSQAIARERLDAEGAYQASLEKISPEYRDALFKEKGCWKPDGGVEVCDRPCVEEKDALLQARCLKRRIYDTRNKKGLPAYALRELALAKVAMDNCFGFLAVQGGALYQCLEKSKLRCGMLDGGALTACVKAAPSKCPSADFKKFPTPDEKKFKFLPDQESPYAKLWAERNASGAGAAAQPASTVKSPGHVFPTLRGPGEHGLPEMLKECALQFYGQAGRNLSVDGVCASIQGTELGAFQRELAKLLVDADLQSYFEIIRMEGLSRLLKAYRQLVGANPARNDIPASCGPFKEGIAEATARPMPEPSEADKDREADEAVRASVVLMRAVQASRDAFAKQRGMSLETCTGIGPDRNCRPNMEYVSQDARVTELDAEVYRLIGENPLLGVGQILKVGAPHLEPKPFPVAESLAATRSQGNQGARFQLRMAKQSLAKDLLAGMNRFCSTDPDKGGLRWQELVGMEELTAAVQARFPNFKVQECVKKVIADRKVPVGLQVANMVLQGATCAVGTAAMPYVLGPLCAGFYLGQSASGLNDASKKLEWARQCSAAGGTVCKSGALQGAILEYDHALFELQKNVVFAGAEGLAVVARLRGWSGSFKSPEQAQGFATELRSIERNTELTQPQRLARLEALERRVAAAASATPADVAEIFSAIRSDVQRNLKGGERVAVLAALDDYERACVTQGKKPPVVSWDSAGAASDAGRTAFGAEIESFRDSWRSNHAYPSTGVELTNVTLRTPEIPGALSNVQLVMKGESKLGYFRPVEQFGDAPRHTLAASELNDLLGLEVVPKSKWVRINGRNGILSETAHGFVPGNDAPAHFARLDSAARADAQAFEFLAGNRDVHPYNYTVSYSHGASGPASLQIFDHGGAFQPMAPGKFTTWNPLLGSDILPSSYSASFRKALADPGFEAGFRARVGGELSPSEIDAVLFRREVLLKDMAGKPAVYASAKL